MFKVSNSSTFQSVKQFNLSKSRTVQHFMSKSLNLTGERMLRVLVLIPGTEVFVSSGMSQLVEVSAGLLVPDLCVQHCQGWRLYLLVLTVPLQALGTACFFLTTFHPTELRMTCLKASQCRFLAPMFDSYEGVSLSLPAQFPAPATV